ncbi:hypothetical protein ACFX1R_027971 [Malus domestica]
MPSMNHKIPSFSHFLIQALIVIGFFRTFYKSVSQYGPKPKDQLEVFSSRRKPNSPPFYPQKSFNQRCPQKPGTGIFLELGSFANVNSSDYESESSLEDISVTSSSSLDSGAEIERMELFEATQSQIQKLKHPASAESSRYVTIKPLWILSISIWY